MRRPRSRILLIAPVAAVLALTAFLWWTGSDELRPKPAPARLARSAKPPAGLSKPAGTPPAAPAIPARETAAATRPAPEPPAVLPPPKPLEGPPEIVKGVYLTSWSAGLSRRVDYVTKLAHDVGVNTVVIDIKDYSGYLAYRVPEAQKYDAVRVKVRDIDSVIRRLHAAGVYAIARITVFQDPVLAVARPELAVHRKSLLAKGGKPSAQTLWRDRKGLAWIDPSSRAAWEYIAAIGRDAIGHGFDELNFDYVRFPSDGNMRDMYFPNSGEKVSKPAVLRAFFGYLRQSFPHTRISADLFGLATVNSDDLGIGQVIEDAYRNFDYVCPMVYPSHYASGFRGFKNPAEHPYEVVRYSMDKAVARLRALEAPPLHKGNVRPAAANKPDDPGVADGRVPPDPAGLSAAPAGKHVRLAKLRPWLQDFDLGAKYDAARVRAQILATEEALGGDYAGYLMWSPSNVYTASALAERAAVASQPAPATPVPSAVPGP